MNKLILTVALLNFFFLLPNDQIGIHTNSTSLSTSSMLDIKASDGEALPLRASPFQNRNLAANNPKCG
ncbi:MAG: hypothetical protein AAF599_18010 [Bacteroidota bacterium]